MPLSDSGFDNRCGIHKDYRGLRGEEFCKAAGITDGEFVHAAGFIGGAWSLESCIKIAEASVAQQEVEMKAKEEEKLKEELLKKEAAQNAVVNGQELEKKQKLD